jgi:hypothetical protein
MSKLRFAILLFISIIGLLSIGCELEAEQEPLSAQDALRAEQEMLRSTDRLLDERAPEAGKQAIILTPPGMSRQEAEADKLP